MDELENRDWVESGVPGEDVEKEVSDDALPETEEGEENEDKIPDIGDDGDAEV